MNDYIKATILREYSYGESWKSIQNMVRYIHRVHVSKKDIEKVIQGIDTGTTVQKRYSDEEWESW